MKKNEGSAEKKIDPIKISQINKEVQDNQEPNTSYTRKGQTLLHDYKEQEQKNTSSRAPLSQLSFKMINCFVSKTEGNLDYLLPQ